jgi:hypothetical protein
MLAFRCFFPQTKQKTDLAEISHNFQRSLQSTIFEISGRLGLSYGSIQRILRENLNIRWMATKFVPRLLTYEEKQWRVWVSGTDGWSQERPTFSLEGCNRRRHLGLVLRHINQTSVLPIIKARPFHVRRERCISGRTSRVCSWSFSNSEGTLHQEFVPPGQMVNQMS